LNKLKNQKEIMLNWKGDISEPLVTIQCLAYNHQNYIKDAIEGFLSQETNFPFEIIIHDDASTDGTAKIIKVYEKKYSKIIKAIYQKENKFQAGKRNEIGDTIYEQTKGKYIALCEGDDYWIDESKLQIQIDEMNKDDNIHLCFHTAKRIDCLSDNDEIIIGKYDDKTSIIPFEFILTRPSGMIPTGSMIYTKEIKKKLIEFTKSNPYLEQADTIIQIIAASKGGSIYIDKTMSVYRYRFDGSWTHSYTHDSKFQISVLLSKIKYFMSLYEFIGLRNKTLFINLIMGVVCQLSILLNNIKHREKESINNILISIFNTKLLEKDLYSSELILYGASTLTKWFIDNFPNIKIKYILDSDINKHNELYNSIIIKHPSKVENKDEIIFITLIGREYQIGKELEEEYNFKKENIIIIDNASFDDFQKIDFIMQDNG
jgi:glycosyltransferase involved in cell wall biosynthesis